MRHLRFVILVANVAVIAAGHVALASITYRKDTSIGDAWGTPSRIPADEAVGIVAARLLAPHTAGTETEIDDREFEALKYLVGNHQSDVEEPAETAGTRRYGGLMDPDTMTADQVAFFGQLSRVLSVRLGLAALASPICVREVPLFQVTKYKYAVGWNWIDVWGIAVFGHDLQYGVNHSDLAYGVFPFGITMSWWDGIRCVLGGAPSNADEVRACGRTKEWMLQGPSTMKLASSFQHVVPGVAQASLPYLGALVNGRAGQFQTNYQTRNSIDPTYLLGPSNTPLPSSVFPADGCVGTCPMGIAVQYHYAFSQVIAWFPDVVLNAAYNAPVDSMYETFTYSGQGLGNPHSLGGFGVTRNFSRFHTPLPACN